MQVTETEVFNPKSNAWDLGPSLPASVRVACVIILDEAETKHLIIADAYMEGPSSLTWMSDSNSVEQFSL